MENSSFRLMATTAVIALAFGFGGAALWSATGLGHAQTEAYLLDNPDILPKMAENFRKQEAQKRLTEVSGEVAAPFPGAVLGNPEGNITLVEFTDYGCSFCRLSTEHVQQLIAKNPDLRVVIREWPIFENSDKAAQMALAAAEQGKFAAFHEAMFAKGPPSEDSILAAAAAANLDLAKAQETISSPSVGFELSKNIAFARQLGFSGTPSWIVGDEVLEGAVGAEQLQAAIDAARDS